jgi:hypothetical protein
MKTTWHLAGALESKRLGLQHETVPKGDKYRCAGQSERGGENAGSFSPIVMQMLLAERAAALVRQGQFGKDRRPGSGVELTQASQKAKGFDGLIWAIRTRRGRENESSAAKSGGMSCSRHLAEIRWVASSARNFSR